MKPALQTNPFLWLKKAPLKHFKLYLMELFDSFKFSSASK